jgi:hypothetical protein
MNVELLAKIAAFIVAASVVIIIYAIACVGLAYIWNNVFCVVFNLSYTVTWEQMCMIYAFIRAILPGITVNNAKNQ